MVELSEGPPHSIRLLDLFQEELRKEHLMPDHTGVVRQIVVDTPPRAYGAEVAIHPPISDLAKAKMSLEEASETVLGIACPTADIINNAKSEGVYEIAQRETARDVFGKYSNDGKECNWHLPENSVWISQVTRVITRAIDSFPEGGDVSLQSQIEQSIDLATVLAFYKLAQFQNSRVALSDLIDLQEEFIKKFSSLKTPDFLIVTRDILDTVLARRKEDDDRHDREEFDDWEELREKVQPLLPDPSS